jgi:hypothetical protein
MTGVLQPADARRTAWSQHATRRCSTSIPIWAVGCRRRSSTRRGASSWYVFSVEPGQCDLEMGWRSRRLAVLQAISTAFAELARAGEIVRGDDGTWLLTGSPVGRPDAKTANFVAPRRRKLPPSADRVAV